MKGEGNVPVRRYCSNCGKIMIGFRSDNGLVKIQCIYCGIVTVSKRMSRRHERIDVYTASEQEI